MARAGQKPEPHLGPLIRNRRKKLGLTLQAAGDLAGVSVGYLSQVERDNATPSLGTLAQIAQALDVGLEYFVATPKPADSLTRAERRPQFAITENGIAYESLAAEFPGVELSSYILHTPPGFVSELSQHEGEEIIYILEGEIEQMLGGEVFTMRQGDSLHYSGATPHSWKNLTDRPARILWVGTLAVLQSAGQRRLPTIMPVPQDNKQL
ncbi:helix-turn-helix domain-containing protein [Aliiruegeria lutimaris]|uniref:Transcriptional regulator, XRE family with cupin sensor n=1 Tax=Aliiruegeria lutimaris TaxID=571298 RepID=A0A1G9KRW6_9RHOB|nr:XRE family transcriptional regulator [Aliiruegeria lutimaris]SDL52590.1 transcriptional regulator, XRE family with cupin sensor [Aliiruegeria lutimaris]